MIRLSICIATVNRAAFIGQTLASILPQLTDAVELVVVDGASTDGTDAIVAEHFRDRLDCHYHRLAEKGGFDQDYCRAVARAGGEYCWLMTDDDLLEPGAVALVLEHLRGEPDLLVVNATVGDAELTRTLLPKKLPLEQDRDFGPDEQAGLLALAGDLLSFIGAVVVRRALWQARAAEPYFGTDFIHVGILFQRPLERSARVLATPLVRIRYGNAQWRARAFDIWMFQWPGLIWSFTHLPEEARAAVTPREPWQRTVHLLQMKARGCFSHGVYRDRLAARPMSRLTRLRVAAIAAFPDVLFNALASLALALLAPWARGTLLELRQSPYDYRRRWFA
jgi:glycosyltransferase involved in cell wall biosynthesis